MAIRSENGKFYGSVVINTTLDPITKSRPNGRAIAIRNCTIKLDGVPNTDVEKKLLGQIGIDFRARVKNLEAEKVRAYCGLTLDWKELYSTSRSAPPREMTEQEMIDKAVANPELAAKMLAAIGAKK